jgi:hypothetical protein
MNHWNNLVTTINNGDNIQLWPIIQEIVNHPASDIIYYQILYGLLYKEYRKTDVGKIDHGKVLFNKAMALCQVFDYMKEFRK